MKTLITLVVALVLLTGNAYSADPGKSTIISTAKNTSVFVLKTEKKYVGATVEIYSSNGDLVTSQNIQKRKMIIDFGSVLQDTYTIRVVKGSDQREYSYIKK